MESNPVGRIGLFVAGYLGLGALWGAHWIATELLGDADLLRAALAGAVTGVLLKVADVLVDGDLAPLGVMAAFGSTLYLALAAHHLGSSTGAHGALLFWTVVAVAVPASIGTLLWVPHPILGVNVAVASTFVAVRAPVGQGGLAEAAGKALLLAFLLAVFAMAVDLRTRSRAGSLLHYAAVAVLAVAKLLVGLELDALVGSGVLAILALGELGIALMLRRRSWAVSGWVTLGLAGMIAVAASFATAPLGALTAAVVAVPLGWAARAVQRRGDEVRRAVLSGLPRELADSFPS